MNCVMFTARLNVHFLVKCTVSDDQMVSNALCLVEQRFWQHGPDYVQAKVISCYWNPRTKGNVDLCLFESTLDRAKKMTFELAGVGLLISTEDLINRAVWYYMLDPSWPID